MNNLGHLTIADACIGDALVILDMMKEAFQEYDGVLNPPSGAHRETVASVRFKLTSGTAALAAIDGRPAGCAFYEPAGDLVYCSRLSVRPAFRNRGIGGALLAYVEDRARVSGVAGVRLGVRVQLPHLIARYERLGYRITRYMTHPGYEQPTWVHMEKRWC